MFGFCEEADMGDGLFVGSWRKFAAPCLELVEKVI